MKSIKLHSIFIGAYVLLLLSRIAVLTGNYTISIDPRFVEIIYVVVTIIIIFYDSRGKISKNQLKPGLVIILMFVHCVFGGLFFINKSFNKYIESQFSSQIVFCTIILFTSFGLKYFHNYYEFISASLYTVGISLTIQLIKNFSELKLNSIINIFNLAERNRANFGFGHYNTLGSVCLCVIILVVLLYEKSKKIKVMNTLFLIEAIAMMLCSASRGAITGGLLFITILMLCKIHNIGLTKKTMRLIHLIELSIILLMLYYVMGLNINYLLQQAQRQHIFEVALPKFIESRRILTGVGYTSNVKYGDGTIFGKILWIDNAYVYYLISTGVIGLLIITLCIIALGVPIFNFRHDDGKVVFALFCIYLYRAMFEVNLFESGYIVNYIYLPIFIVFIYEKKLKFKK